MQQIEANKETIKIIAMTKMFDFVLKGANASQLEKDIGSDMFPANEHYFGLVNVSKYITLHGFT